MGDNGSGKSTFLLSLLGLLKPAQGRVEVQGQDTHCTPTSRLARAAGFVFQNPDHQLFAESVWQEAVFAPQNFSTLDAATTERVRSLLACSGLTGREDEQPYRLSYGEKRRLNLISALAASPRLILLDEVLIGQDPANAAFLMDLLAGEVRRDSAVVMVSHDPDVVQAYATRILFFDDGQVVLDAPAAAAFTVLAAQGCRPYLPSSWPAGEVGP